MNETTGKLEVLTILNQEFFNEIREKKDEQTLINHFGSAHGRLLWRHTILEKIYDEARGENDMAMAGEEEGEQEGEQSDVRTPLESVVYAPLVFKNVQLVGVMVPDMGGSLPWEGDTSEHLVTVEISLDGQQYTENGLQFLYKATNPSLSDEELKALEAEDAKGKKAVGKKK